MCPSTTLLRTEVVGSGRLSTPQFLVLLQCPRLLGKVKVVLGEESAENHLLDNENSCLHGSPWWCIANSNISAAEILLSTPRCH